MKIASFLTLHILNLCTPLAPTRYNVQAPGVRNVDITGWGIRSALKELADSHHGPVETAEKDLLVKVSPPVYIHLSLPPTATNSNSGHSPIISPIASSNANASMRSTSEIVENFMSTWTRLVGDPVLSKWIVMVLALSVSLNGYLLKGIAAGFAGKGIGAKGGVRFETMPLDDKTSSHVPKEVDAKVDAMAEDEGEAGASAEVESVPKRQAEVGVEQIVAPVPTCMPKLMLDKIDQRLKTEGHSLRSDLSERWLSDDGAGQEPTYVRPLAECLDIFENGPKPTCVALSMLNDEEVVLLAQNGKIAAYALEKVLEDNERAVRVRRALICEFACSRFASGFGC
jgi:hydroxymethylglutaryl-CoA reductase (NADPH)